MYKIFTVDFVRELFYNNIYLRNNGSDDCIQKFKLLDTLDDNYVKEYKLMHQSFVTTAPPPPTYSRDGRGIAGLMCGAAVTFGILPQCRVCDITQIYPHGSY